MASRDENTGNVWHRNEWEVIPDLVEDDSMNEEEKSSIGRAETSDVMYMSRHFLFPPSQHENLPLEPETYKVGGDAGPGSIHDYEAKAYMEDEDNLNIEESGISQLCHGIPIFDEHGNMLAVRGIESQQGLTLEKENLYNAVKYSSSQSESVSEEDSIAITESAKIVDQGLDSGVSSAPMFTDKGEYDESNLPCEAWWKKHVTSIFVTATVMGLVILGQRYQQESWKVLQLKWQLNINEEKMSKLLSPLIRFKDGIVRGYRPGSLIRGSSSEEH